MGFLDILRGKRELKQPAPDRLFAMSTAYVKMDMELGLRSAGKAAIVFQPLATADFDGIVKDMEEVVEGTGSDAGTKVTKTDDEYDYRWMILEDPDCVEALLFRLLDAEPATGPGPDVLAMDNGSGPRVAVRRRPDCPDCGALAPG